MIYESDIISYIYSAAGEKLAKRMTNGTYKYYARNMVYNPDKTLNYLLFEEGMVNKVTGGYVYEYHLKDHLGNTRVAFQPNGPTTTTTQVAEYYPFGSSYLPVSPIGTNKYLYNGKEKQDDVLSGTALDWYDYGARFYDPTIGRWHSLDRFAEKYISLTPYQYAANNPVRNIDVNGDSLMSINLKGADADNPQTKQRDYYVDSKIGYNLKGFAEEAIGEFKQLSVNNIYRPNSSSDIKTGNTKAKGLSRHQGGFAIDFNGVKTLSKDQIKILNKIAKDFGLAPIANQSSDPPHFDSDPTNYGYSSLKDAVNENKTHYDNIKTGKSDPVKFDEKKYEETKKKVDEKK